MFESRDHLMIWRAEQPGGCRYRPARPTRAQATIGGVFDLVDEIAGCGSTWTKNAFGTSRADVVTSPACIE